MPRVVGLVAIGSFGVLAFASSASAQTVADVAAQHACDTSGVQGLSDQLVNLQMCMNPGAFVSFVPHSNVTLTSTRIHAFLVSQSRDALWTASGSLDLQINSAFRTLADQYVLYYSGACALAAIPGNSNHETGRAVDLSNWSAAIGAMTSAGCTHTYPSSDPVHFDCPGPDMRSASVVAFQHLWNINNPTDQIAEDGSYGPVTGDRLGRSPAGGFANPGSCAPATPDWAGQFVSQSFPLAGAGALMMAPGDSVAAWIDMKNIGAQTWNSNTRLGTTQPRDRSSPFVASDWIAANRPSAVSGTVAPNGTYRFMFTFHAPSTPGSYDEHFGMVQEGTAWFSDPGQGGPADSLLEARIIVTAPADAGVMDAGTRDASVDATADAMRTDVARVDGAHDGGADGEASVSGDGSARADASGDANDEGTTMRGGCGCAVPGRHDARGLGALALGALALTFARRRRRDRTR